MYNGFSKRTNLRFNILIILLFFVVEIACASPWMTGPIIAPNGRTIEPGHFNFEPYGFYTVYPQNFRNFETVPILTFGATSFMDILTFVPYDFNWKDNQEGHNVADYSLGFGLQFLREVKNSWLPDLRMVILETFPTGKYDRLDPKKLGTDQTGLGSYQTTISFNFQKLLTLKNDRYLRMRLGLAGSHATEVSVTGVNVFGGDETTKGKERIGNNYSAVLAFEYTLTQNWVPVFEVLFVNSGGTDFSGSTGFSPGGTTDTMAGGAGGNQTTIAPALEYNFNEHLGIIGGVWFPINGPRTGQFKSYTLAINYYY